MIDTSKAYSETAFKLQDLFLSKGAFFNDDGELILIPKTNTYIIVKNKNRKQIIATVLEYLTQDTFKTEPFSSSRKNREYQNYMRDAINEFLGQYFTRDDFALIYDQLGNGINRPLTNEFIDSDYNLIVLGQINLF